MSPVHEHQLGLFSAAAIQDFTVAVEQAPYFADGWKRRGQARSALGHHKEALEVQNAPNACSLSRCAHTHLQPIT